MGDSGQGKDFRDIKIIGFERHGKRDDVKVMKRFLGLYGKQRRPAGTIFLNLIRSREEGTLADHIAAIVQKPVDPLEPEVAHSGAVMAGIYQTDGEFSPPSFCYTTLFYFEKATVFLNNLPGHA
jgi:hypothetical protein